MAALDTPWTLHMSTSKSTSRSSDVFDGSASSQLHGDVPPLSSYYAPPTYASFSPANLSSTGTAASVNAATSAAKRRSTILVHQKSPLLLATPPQVTRALAYSHPFLLPLNKVAGLISWTTDDPWESFLLLVAFWAVVQYGDAVLRYAAPIAAVAALIAGMYGRRFSPLSSSGWTDYSGSNVFSGGGGSSGRKNASGGGGGSGGTGSGGSAGGTGSHRRDPSESTSTRHQKTLDEIVDTLKVFTTRCNILLEPLLEMTDFLSTQRTATSATTRPALTTLFVRILAVTPVWIALTLPPLRIITTRRVVLVFGTMLLTWHSKASRISRTLLWRSAAVRKLACAVTGLPFEIPSKRGRETKDSSRATDTPGTGSGKQNDANRKNGDVKTPSSALTAALKRNPNQYHHHRRSGRGLGDPDRGSAVRFTFILYENQRRWVGLGWTNSLFAYERSAWTDEQNNPMPSRENFELPEVDDDDDTAEGAGHGGMEGSTGGAREKGSAALPQTRTRWRWVRGSRWRVDGAPELDDAAGGYDTDAARNGWIYYDNTWQNGRRGQDGWNRWTRRRKWYRDAELVEASSADDEQDDEQTPVASPEPPAPALPPRTPATDTGTGAADATSDAGSSSQRLSTSDPVSRTLYSSSPHIRSSSRSTGDPTEERDEEEQEHGEGEEADLGTLETPLSTSSKSTTTGSRFKWPTPTLRRRATGGSTASAPGSQKKEVPKAKDKNKQRSRRPSETGSARSAALSASPPNDDDGLNPTLELEIQGHRKGLDAWGIGDEAQMGLE